MKITHILAAFAATTLAANAATVIASTGFETSEGFTGTVTSGFSVTDANGDYWEAGNGGTQYTGLWANGVDSSQGAVWGRTANNYLLFNPAGAEGIGTIEFVENQTGGGANDIAVEWSLDGSNWNLVETITPTSGSLTSRTIEVNQAGDVQVRLRHLGGGHTTIDNVTITAVPEPSAAVLFGLGGLALILRRRK